MEYEPLNSDKDEIRVVTLLPSSAWPGHPDKICCSLENVSLRDYTPTYERFIGDRDLRYKHLSTFWRQMQRVVAEGVNQQQHLLSVSAETLDELNLPSLWRYKWGDFAALSYTWHETSLVDKIIYINGHSMSITGNLYNALSRLRVRLRRGLKLWVDAICINQADINERNLQVKRMGHIYGQALNTILWTGEEVPEIGRAFSFLRELGLAGIHSPEASKDILNEGLGLDDRDMLIGLNSFFKRPYWRRVWIIQELAAHVSTQVVFCGSHEMMAELLFSALRSMFDKPERIREIAISIQPFHNTKLAQIDAIYHFSKSFRRIFNLYLVSQIDSSTLFPIAAGLLLRLSISAEQTDMRDKIYGILGIFGDLYPELVDEIVPEYQLSVSQVFIGFTKAAILYTRSLEHIRRAGIPRAQMHLSATDIFLPSWVEDLTSGNDNLNMLSGTGRDLSKYSAGGPVFSGVQFLDKDFILSCHGILLDIVDGMSPVYDVSKEDVFFPSSAKPVSSEIVYDSEAAIKDSLWNTLCRSTYVSPNLRAGILNVLCDTSPNAEEFEYNSELRAFLFHDRNISVGGRSLTEWLCENVLANLTEPPSSKSDIDHTIKEIHYNLVNRKLVTTNAGFIGVTHWATEQGDRVCVFPGCSVPLIIRLEANGDYYKLIGECYIDGIMDGEAMEWLKMGQVQLETICLC